MIFYEKILSLKAQLKSLIIAFVLLSNKDKRKKNFVEYLVYIYSGLE